MRILHLLDLRGIADDATTLCRAAVSIPDAHHRVVALGNARGFDSARRAGLVIDAAVPPIGPWPEFAFRRLRAVIADRDGRNATRPWADVVQCWSPEMLGIARLASGQRTPPRVGALLHAPVFGGETHRRRLKFGLDHARLFTLDAATRERWGVLASARRGGRLLEQNIRLFAPPSVQPSPASPARESARSMLGLRPDEIAVAFLADPPENGDLARLSFLMGLLFTTGLTVVGLARSDPHRPGAGSRRAARFVRMHGRRWGLALTNQPLDLLLAAADFAVADASGAGGDVTLSAGGATVARAIAAGLPMAAPNHPLYREHLGPVADRCIARDQTLTALADRLIWLIDDRARAAAVADEARRHLHARCAAPDGFTLGLSRLWGEAADVPVMRPGLPLPLALEPRLEGAA